MTSRVAHPILRLVVVRPDGSRTVGHRVFCRFRRHSVDAATCATCPHRTSVLPAPDPAMVCTIPVPEEQSHVDMVGAVLRHGTVALDPSASIGKALELLRASDQRSLAVVDADGALVGVVHEVTFIHPTTEVDDVSTAMSSALALHETTTVRRALRLLASAHLREATVVDEDGRPLGVFRDVDGLRYLARTRAMLYMCDVDSSSE